MMKCMLNNLFSISEVQSLNPTTHAILIYLYPLPQKIYLCFHIFIHLKNTKYLLFLILTIWFLKPKALTRCRCNTKISHFQKPYTELSFPSLATSLCYKSVTFRSCSLTENRCRQIIQFLLYFCNHQIKKERKFCPIQGPLEWYCELQTTFYNRHVNYLQHVSQLLKKNSFY